MGEHIETAYKRIELAMRDGKLVQRCSIDQDGKAISWNTFMMADVRIWHPSRYRIEGKEVWPDYVSDSGRVARPPHPRYGDPGPLEIIRPDAKILKMMEEIQHQNRMILEAFATPRVILKKAEEQKE